MKEEEERELCLLLWSVIELKVQMVLQERWEELGQLVLEQWEFHQSVETYLMGLIGEKILDQSKEISFSTLGQPFSIM